MMKNSKVSIVDDSEFIDSVIIIKILQKEK